MAYHADEEVFLIAGYKRIVEVPGRCGGRATVMGSRIRPSVVVASYESFGAEEFHKIWDHISREEVEECYTYCKATEKNQVKA